MNSQQKKIAMQPNEELNVENPFGNFLIEGASHLFNLSFAKQNIL
jgi:hypothetical protein